MSPRGYVFGSYVLGARGGPGEGTCKKNHMQSKPHAHGKPNGKDMSFVCGQVCIGLPVFACVMLSRRVPSSKDASRSCRSVGKT